MDIKIPQTLEEWQRAGDGYLPDTLGISIESVSEDEVVGTMQASRALSAWNGFLHAGAIVSLADTLCGYGTVAALPEGASGFTTVEIKSNFLRTVKTGIVEARAAPLHKGRTTQVWDAVVRERGADKAMAHFRCTQMILWPKAT
jgi:uncharacterized protein (TIGR00369 family)